MTGRVRNPLVGVAITVAIGSGVSTVNAQKIYWSDSASHKIRRANLDGSDREDLIPHSASQIALDLAGGKFYWTSAAGIHRANLDGSDVEELTTASALGIALDVTGGKMYWTDVSDNRIRRSNLDGSEIEDLVGTGPDPLDASWGIALDLGTRQMYWVNDYLNRIQRANLDGADVVDLVTGGFNNPRGLALDLSRGKMYWTAVIYAGPGHVILRATLDGSDVEIVLATAPLSNVVALDSDAGKVYWSESDVPSAESGRIRRADLDGTGVEDIVVGLGTPRGFALDLRCTLGGPDCQPNGIPDLCEVATGGARDCNDNYVPDECDIAEGTSDDCNADGVPDECEPDCNENGVADECDLADGTSQDCNDNGIPDECEPDCNGNGIADSCDIADGTSEDCANEGIPDECEPDCNENGIADSCDIADGTSEDCADEGIPDECEPDCNENGIADSCDVADGASEDCDDNGVPDECDLAGGMTLPCGIIEFAPGASTGSFEIEGNEIIIPSGGVQVDFEILLWGWGNVPGNPLLGAYNAVFHGESLWGANAIPPTPGVDLSTPYPLECETPADCPAPSPPPVVQTGTCGILFPGWCDDSVPGYFLPRVCSDDLATPCWLDSDCAGSALCVDNPRYIFPSDMDPVGHLTVYMNDDIQWSGLAWMVGQGAQDPDGVTKFLGGVLRLIVPEDARGTYPIRFLPGPEYTFILDPEGPAIPSTIIDGQLTIGGACCMADGSCEILLEGDCGATGGTYVDGFCGDDTDNDGKVDVCDPCPNDDPDDSDGDGVCDSDDGCPFDPNKTDPGLCGCGIDDQADSDADGIPDCDDQCPGLDDPTFAPDCIATIPTISSWGVIILTLLLLVAGKIQRSTQECN